MSKHITEVHDPSLLCMLRFAGCEYKCGRMDRWDHHLYSDHLQTYEYNCSDCPRYNAKPIYNLRDFRTHVWRRHKRNWRDPDVAGHIEECRRPHKKLPEMLSCCSSVFNGGNALESLLDYFRKNHIGKGKVYQPSGSFREFLSKAGIIFDSTG